jgi:uncharacterized membrane protein YgaE (UPF0421/DUF939 family)
MSAQRDILARRQGAKAFALRTKEKAITPLPHFPLDKLRHLWSSKSPFLLFAIKSALAAGFSWGVAYSLIGREAASLAVVSALIVVQVTSWQTVRKSIERILGVIIGVSLAILVTHFAGLNTWTITLMIFIAQIVSMFLQHRGQYLATQIPISAGLALLIGGSSVDSYPLLRMLGAVVGGFVGTIVSLLLSPPIYVFRARDAFAALMIRLANALPALADALAVRISDAENRALYTRIRELEQHVQSTAQALSLGFDSARLNPWAHRASRLLIAYPDLLLALDRLTRQMRRISYTLNEPAPSWSEIAQQQGWARDYAHLLAEIGSILAAVAQYLRSPATHQSSNLPSSATLSTRVKQAQQQLSLWQAQLAQDAQHSKPPTEHVDHPSIDPGYRLAIRGAILTDLRRMLDEVHDVVATAVQRHAPQQPTPYP